MNTFFNDTMIGLLQAISIEKGLLPIAEVEDMPAKTYRVVCEIENAENKQQEVNKQRNAMS